MLKIMGRQLKQVLWHSLGLNPPNRGLERTVAVLRLQRQALNTKLAQTQADLVQLRTELAGTQAGERTAKYQAMHDGLTGQPNRRMFMAALLLRPYEVSTGGIFDPWVLKEAHHPLG